MRRPARFQHVLATRLNVKRPGWKEVPEDWLDHRLGLLERYCLPSIVAQSCQRFEWLLFCDVNTAERDLHRIRALSNRFKMVLHEPWTPVDLRPFVASDADCFISTRLDSDDALHTDAVAIVQAHSRGFIASVHPKWLHLFPQGYKIKAKSGRAYWANELAVLSLFERTTEPIVGVTAFNHSYGERLYPAKRDDSLAAWAQTIHGFNDGSRVHKREEMNRVRKIDAYGFPHLA